MSDVRTNIETRFLRYVQIDTESDEGSLTTPSTQKQYDLLNLLADELRGLGAEDVVVTDYACTLATIPATMADAPTVAYLAHVDTTQAYCGTNVKPIVHRNYDGAPLVLPDDNKQVIDPSSFPYLATKVGEDVVTASGLTLLGADDKAGVAIIMTLAETLLNDTSIPHGKVRIVFTPDEEIGRGVEHLTAEDVAADVAYTLDGGKLGQVVYETFSADKATITITGVSVHPGYAKDQMVNAGHLAAKLADKLPQADCSPETTSGYDGFIHLYKMEGNAAEMTLHLILRDFTRDGLAEKGKVVERISAEIQALEPRATVHCAIQKQYRNMYDWLKEDMRPVELAQAAVRNIGLEPISDPVRGGTDGARLTALGIPTPNLFTGMQNYHGPLEYVSLHDMEKSHAMCVELVKLWAAT